LECKHFGACGACRIYKDGYDAQLDEKLNINKDRFKDFYADDIKVYRSPTQNYRSRAEFKIWHIDDEIHYAMNHLEHKGVVLIEECPQVNEHIESMMPRLLQKIKEYDIGFKLFGADFLSSQSGELVVSLIYHRRLDEQWQRQANKISEELDIYIIGRSRKQKVVVGQDFITEELQVEDERYRFNYIENSFTQPNSKVNEQMIQWAISSLEDTSSDLLELYCGAGNFTIPFAKRFNRVLATEISKSSINAAKTNMTLNSVSNIEFVRMSVEEFVEALDGVREFRRMKDIDIESYDINTIFVDPPRSGMDLASCEFSARQDNIIYISCNPETLVRDLDILSKTHEVVDMALFDQFPYTHHVEMGVKLKRR
jgi:tRNA (uracil-5-)-methyltransferase